MTGNEFQQAVMRTAANGLTQTEALTNASMGIAGEAGEYIDMLKKWMFHGHPIDELKCKKELGDIMFYVAWAAKEQGFELDDVMNTVIEKLKIRFPNGFNSADSIARRDVTTQS